MEKSSVWVAVVAILAIIVIVFVAQSYSKTASSVTGAVVINQCCIYQDGRGYITSGACDPLSHSVPCSDVETLILPTDY